MTITVIGIDPGSRRTGWGVVRETSGVLSLVDCGVIRSESAAGVRRAGGARPGSARGHAAPGAPAARVESDFSLRLAHIYHELTTVLARHRPDEGALEQVFTARNAASALKLGQARGVAVAACASAGLPVSDYEPTLVKQSLVGTGRAEKEQVAFMVRRLLNIRADSQGRWPLDVLDVTDALAVAICHLGMRRLAALARR